MRHVISIKTTNGVLSIADFKAQRVAKSDVIGVVLQTKVIGVIISLDQWKEIWCSEENYKVFNKVCGEAEALQILSGLKLTRNIFQQNKKDVEGITAALRCWTYPKGNLQWYLPSLYELGTIIAYREELNEVLKMLDADLFNEGDWGWSSSEFSTHHAWAVNLGNGFFSNHYKCNSNVVRAVSEFTPLQRDDSPLRNENDQQLTEASAIEYLRKLGYTGELVKKVNV